MISNSVKKAITAMSVFLVKRLETELDITREEALEKLMKTAVYEALQDPETMIYCESKEAVYDMLKAELNGNPAEILCL